MIASLLTGFFLAPFVSFGVRLAVEVVGPAAAGRTAFGLAAGFLVLAFGAATSLARLARETRRRDSTLAPFLLGLAPGLLLHDAVLLPQCSYRITLPVALAGLAVAWWTRRRTNAAVRGSASEAATAGPRSLRIVDAMVAGLLLGFAAELARPFALQHLAGTRSSHATLAAMMLFGAGLGALVPLPKAPRPWLRAAGTAAALAIVWFAFTALRAAADGRVYYELPFALREDARLFEIVAANKLGGLGSVAAGMWLRLALGGRPRIAVVGLLLIAGALGGRIAHRALDEPGMWPEAVLGARDAYVRFAHREKLEEHLVTSDGVLRAARDYTHAAGSPHLLWQGRRATRTPDFAEIEKDEVLLAGDLVPDGGHLLLAGIATAPHREAFGMTPFASIEIASPIPHFPTPETLDDPRLARADVFALRELSRRPDAIVVLAAPELSWEHARLLQRGFFERCRQTLGAHGTLLAWIDLRATPLEAAAAVARAADDAFGSIRCWVALDGYAGPFLGIEAGPLREVPRFATRSVLPGEALLGASSRTATLLDPLPENLVPLRRELAPVAPGERLRALAAGVRGARGRESLALLLDALAVHADAYHFVETVNEPLERHVVTDAEVELLRAAFDRDADDPAVLNQARRFLQLAFERREYERLDRLLLPVLEQHPDDVGLRFLSGSMNFDLFDDESAIEDLEVVVREHPGHLKAQILLGRAYHRLGDLAAARSALDAALGIDPESITAMRAMGMLLVDAGDVEQGLKLLERVDMRQPGDTEIADILRSHGRVTPHAEGN